ncbi:hypothetical protein B0H15DRAFT_147237 [Mycena belliarum]|uniref:Tyrosinase copper-binding domain-containing protein n=1 Tax=Mycena belliarum TaxID=1033014 RepID=A0AAD6XUL1_9AGAR|nr:hypothetical protein B0H15DRAFT_147237 [Mycena belliae]
MRSFFVLSAGLCAAAAAVSLQVGDACDNPVKRVEWRTLGTENQKQYIEAVLCLKTKPSGLGLNTTRYDDFPYVHTKLDKTIHTVAMFLPWHRLFVQVYEDALADCGYTGPMAYWDWTLDTADPTKAPVWDTVTGFGGNGDPAIDPLKDSSSKKCVIDGPLKGIQPAYQMGGYAPHCLARNFNSGIAFPGNMLADSYTQKVVAEINALDDYPAFRYRLEGGPHGAIHSAVGGDMSPATSPNDPIFFLHHAQVDRLWTLWQQEKPAVRNTQFGGPKTRANTTQATLEDVMPYLNLVPDIKVAEVMTTQNARFCYTY